MKKARSLCPGRAPKKKTTPRKRLSTYLALAMESSAARSRGGLFGINGKISSISRRASPRTAIRFIEIEVQP
jgi:hypothetical protein